MNSLINRSKGTIQRKIANQNEQVTCTEEKQRELSKPIIKNAHSGYLGDATDIVKLTYVSY